MYSLLQRMNQVFMFAVSVLAVIALCANLLALLQDQHPEATVRFSNIALRSVGRVDEAFVKFDIDADLSSAFTWNTCYIFASVLASYSTQANTRNEVVLWDDIIGSAAAAKFSRHDVYSEYRFQDVGHGLRANNISLSLKWNVMPCSGLLTYAALGSHSRVFPDA